MKNIEKNDKNAVQVSVAAGGVPDGDIDKIIEEQVYNGLWKPSIEAIIGRKFNEQEKELYKRLKAERAISERQRIDAKGKEGPKTVTERVRKHRDKAASIDDEMNAAFANINWKRRNEAEKSLPLWVKTYCVPTILAEEQPPLGDVVLEQMQHAITAHDNYTILMGRGSGKTSYTECCALYAIATGLQKFVVIISANQRKACSILQDIYRQVAETDSAFANDYPELFLPFNLTNGAYRQRQLYNGATTDIVKNSRELVFARLKDEKGEMPTSGSIITCCGITSGLRGMKHGNLRPTFVILDDLQSPEQAENPEAVEKLMELIRKDVIPLAGKERLSILQTATQICPDDLVQKIKDDKSWKVTTFPAIIEYPEKMELWEQYFKLYDEERVEGTSHDESLAFYKEHFDEMNKGSQVFNPTRYSERDGHLSAIQKLLELKHNLGDSAFQAEYQQNPIAMKFALNITPELVASRKSNLLELEVPDENVQFVCAASDLNVSQYITTVIMVFLRNQSSVVIWHKFKKCRIPANIPPEDYTNRLYNLLGEHGRELQQLGVPIQAWSIDANGLAWNAVTEFAKQSIKICGIPACAFVGRSSQQFRSYMRTRLTEERNRTLLCGNEDEHRKAGSGKKYTFFDSDLYHEKVQKGFLQEVGNLGSISWYEGDNHAKWAVQVCGEKLMNKREKPDGTIEYTWKENGSAHDALDAIGQCLASYGSMGFSTGVTGVENAIKKKPIRRQRKVRIV